MVSRYKNKLGIKVLLKNKARAKRENEQRGNSGNLEETVKKTSQTKTEQRGNGQTVT